MGSRRERRVMGGCVGSAVRKLLCPVKYSYRTAMPTHPPILLTTGPRNPRVHKTTYATMISTAPCVMFLMRADTLQGGVGRGLALEISSFVGPKWHSPIGSMPFRRGQQNSRFPVPTPFPLPLVMYLPASKTLRTGPLKS